MKHSKCFANPSDHPAFLMCGSHTLQVIYSVSFCHATCICCRRCCVQHPSPIRLVNVLYMNMICIFVKQYIYIYLCKDPINCRVLKRITNWCSILSINSKNRIIPLSMDQNRTLHWGHAFSWLVILCNSNQYHISRSFGSCNLKNHEIMRHKSFLRFFDSASQLVSSCSMCHRWPMVI